MTNGNDNLARRVLSDPVHLVAFGFGTGLSPIAPGTAGSLLGVGLAWLTLGFGLAWQLVIAVVICVLGIRICGESSRRLGVHDHGGIVWDEICGMYLTLLVVPPGLLPWVAGFVLFRFMDIVKPWPIRDLDHRLQGGLGIMLDDVVAALYAALPLVFWGWLMN